MQRIRQHTLTRFLCGLVAAIILNISVDAPDLYDNSVPEDLKYNDIESVIEWVLEDVCQIENAIPEYEDNDENSPLKIDKKIQLFYQQRHIAASPFPTKPFLRSKRNPGEACLVSQTELDGLIQPPDA